MNVSSTQLDDEDVEWVLQFAHGNAPSATAALFEAQTFALVDGPEGPLQDLPWPTHDCGDASTLIDLFDRSSASEVSAAMGRAQLATIGTTTVRSLAGQPIQLTLLTFGPQSKYMLAVLDSTTTLEVAEATPGSSIRTRIECDVTGHIMATDGPPGSYAKIDMELGPWAENLIAPNDRTAYHQAVEQVLSGEPYISLQSMGAAPGLYFGITVVRNNDTIIIDLHDRSHQVAAIEALKRSQTQFDQLSETLPVGVFVVEAEGRTKFASEKLREMLGPRIATEFGWLESIHPDDQAHAAEAFADLPKNRHFNIEIRSKQASGDYTWSRWVGSDVRDDDGLLEYVVGFVEDISEWRELNHRIAYQASFDGLTDLPNRITLLEELRGRLEAQAAPKMTGVLFIDLDSFKLINDTQGHSVGDIVLLEVAQRFRRALRPNDLIGRFGGDEFVVVASDISGRGRGPGDRTTTTRRLVDARTRRWPHHHGECVDRYRAVRTDAPSTPSN